MQATSPVGGAKDRQRLGAVLREGHRRAVLETLTRERPATRPDS
ncbi:hypothetical protein ACOM2C_15220 [Pseudarthrobacter sp. So.54]